MTSIEVKKIGNDEMKVLEGCPAVVIYEGPSDYPDKFIGRLWDIRRGAAVPTEIVVLAATLKEIREKLPQNILYPVSRFPDDDPCIVEVWI